MTTPLHPQCAQPGPSPWLSISVSTVLAATMMLTTAPNVLAAPRRANSVQATRAATAPASLRFFSPNAYRVDVDITHKRTGTTFNKAMKYRDQSDMFHLNLPQGLFKKNDPLVLTFHPYNKFNQPLPIHTVNYAMGQTPEYFASTQLHANQAKKAAVQVRTLQKNQSTSPTMQVYIPPFTPSPAAKQPIEKQATKKTFANATVINPAPTALVKEGELLAARVHSYDSSLMSFHSLRPVPRQKDWYELQMPSFWFGKGDTVVVDLVASKQLNALKTSTAPDGPPTDMRLLHTFTYKTLSNEVLEQPQTPKLELSQ